MSKFFNLTGTQAYINQFKGRIGNVSQLKTTSKNLTGAINELKLAVANLQPQQSKIISQDYSTWYDTNVTTGRSGPFIGTSSGTILAKTADGSKYRYSEDNGLTWQDVTNLQYQADYIVETSNRTLIAGSNWPNVIKYSEDGGKTWQNSNSTYSKFRIYDPGTGVIIAAAFSSSSDENYSGIYYSEDNGKTWQPSNITNKIMWQDAIILVSNNRLLAGIDNKIYYSDDGGKTWQNTNVNGRSFILADDGTIVASYQSGYVIKYSEDNGLTWQNCNRSGQIDAGNFYKTNGIILASIDGSLYYSEDSGKTWTSSGISASNAKDIWTMNGRLMINRYYSEDNGKTWTEIYSAPNRGNIKGINNGTMIYYSYDKPLKYSDDGGSTWQSTNISNVETLYIASDGTVLAGTYSDGIKYCYVSN